MSHKLIRAYLSRKVVDLELNYRIVNVISMADTIVLKGRIRCNVRLSRLTIGSTYLYYAIFDSTFRLMLKKLTFLAMCKCIEKLNARKALISYFVELTQDLMQ
jgi:hypothetical protein